MKFLDCEAKGDGEDLLGRGPFVDKIIRDIFDTDTSEASFVLGIDGVWGEGKSSTKNFIEQSLSKQDKKTLFVNFNPWQWSNEDRLIEHFFNELAATLSKVEVNTKGGIAKKLIQYLDYLEHGRQGLKSFNSSVKAFVSFFLGSSLSTIFMYVGPIDTVYKTCALIVFLSLMCLFFLEKFTAVVVYFLTFFKIKEGESERTIQELKLDIHRRLSASTYKIVIAVDDIDRLNRQEIRTLFKVIKVNADFPNLVYMLLFDKKIVSNSLNEEGVFRGDVYLEKIVNIFYPLPKLDNRKFIQSFLTQSLNETLDEFQLDENFDQGRWQEIYFKGLEFQFTTLRDVKRYISSLKSSIKTFLLDGKLEIDLIDLIAMEGVKLFRSEVFQTVFENKALFTSSPDAATSKEEAKGVIKEMLEREIRNEEEVKNILGAVFPNARWTWTNMNSNVSTDSYANKRLNDEDIFDRYFSNFIGDGDFPEAIFEKTLKIIKSPKAFVSFCEDLKQKGTVSDFLEKLFSYKEKFSKEKSDAISILDSLYQAADVLDDSSPGFFVISERTHLQRLIYWYFKKQEFNFDRKEVLKSVAVKTDGFSEVIVDLYGEYQRADENKQGADFYIFEPSDKQVVLKLLNSKIEEAVGKGVLSHSPRLPRLIKIWKELDLISAEKWFKEYISEDQNLMNFLTKLESRSSANQGKRVWYNYYISEGWFEVFFEKKEDVIKRVDNLNNDSRFSSEKYQRVSSNLNNMNKNRW